MTAARTTINVIEHDLDRVLAGLGVTHRAPFVDTDALSGCRFERAEAADGATYILKHMAYEEDWIMRATGDVDCRAAAFWASPLHRCLPPTIDDAMVAAVEDAGVWTLVMRDVASSLVPKAGVVADATRERLFADLARMYASFGPECRPAFALSMHDRLRFLQPDHLDAVRAEPASWAREWWELFADVAPDDIVPTVLALVADPTPVADALMSCPVTFVHGDPKFPNVGVNATHTVLLDWQLSCVAPPAIDLAWFVAMSGTRCGVSRDDVIDSFGHHVWSACDGFRDDWDRAVDLSLIGTFIHVGGMKAFQATASPDPDERAREAHDFAWWIARVRAALHRGVVG